MSARRSGGRRAAVGDGPDRAVIDIGSNTVRLVVYWGSRRAPSVWLNEKVTARLGRDLAATGRIPGKAIDLALSGLMRFAAILRDIGVTDVQTVATAAVRDAANGAEFLDEVRGLGLDPRLLSGEEEANSAALGVIGAFPGAEGVVADLGGGSLELVAIGEGACRNGVSLPLGTLRLPALKGAGRGAGQQGGEEAFRKGVVAEIARSAWAPGQPGPLYLVGGTWRALAAFAMSRAKWPLTDPHAFSLTVEEADKIAARLARMEPKQLVQIPGISTSRAAGLPDAAAMLRVLLEQLRPAGLVFSSWGLREGLLYERLGEIERAQDPLLTAVADFAAPRGGSLSTATMIAGWTSDATARSGNGSERLRLAAILLSQAQQRLEPNMRLSHAFDWAMHKRWVGLDHRGRALIGAALRGACAKPEPTEALLRVVPEAELREAAGWGLAFRLCRRIGAGSRASMLTSRLRRDNGRLTLWLDESRSQLLSPMVEADLAALANWLGCEAELSIGEPAP